MRTYLPYVVSLTVSLSFGASVFVYSAPSAGLGAVLDVAEVGVIQLGSVLVLFGIGQFMSAGVSRRWAIVLTLCAQIAVSYVACASSYESWAYYKKQSSSSSFGGA